MIQGATKEGFEWFTVYDGTNARVRIAVAYEVMYLTWNELAEMMSAIETEKDSNDD